MSATEAKIKKRLPREILEILLCGGIAGSVAKTIIAPFDRVKIHFQIHNPALEAYSGKIGGVFSAISGLYKTSGLTGLYRGHSAMLIRIFPYAAINFLSYEFFKKILYDNQKAENVVWWKRILAGSLAGSMSVTFTYPLDIIRARLAYDLNPRSHPKISSLSHLASHYWEAPRSVFRELSVEGRALRGYAIAGFYQGFVPTLTGIFPYAGVSYFSFETLKIFYSKLNPESISNVPVPIKLLMGMISGALAQTAAYPFDIVRRHSQLCHRAPHLSELRFQKNSFINIASEVIKKHGISGLFKGLSINYLKVAPATGISFVIYEYLKENVFHIQNT